MIKPSRLLLNIFYNFKKNKFPNDRLLLHQSIYKLQRKYPILEVFPFKKSLFCPESKTLDQCLWSLQPEFIRKSGNFYEFFEIDKNNIKKLFIKHPNEKIINNEIDKLTNELEIMLNK